MLGQSDDMVQLLAPDGTRVEHPDFSFDGDTDHMLASLRQMWLGRRFDVEATALQRHGELGLWPPQLGQEAAQVGAARSIAEGDSVFPAYREHSVALALGVPMRQILAFFRGADAGDWEMQEKFRTYALVIGVQALHAVGYAMGLQFDGERSGVMVFHGDGASSQGDVNEAYVFAASYNAPVVFFCQNNQWAISEPISLQSRIPLYQRARGFGFPGIQVDGNDVLAVEAVSKWAMDRARRGEGPTFIEAYTYRMGAHTTADDPTKYRGAHEEEAWRGRDPINRLVAHLRSIDAIDDAFLRDLEEEADALGAETRAAIQQLGEVTMDQWFDDVYAENTVALEAQRREHAEYVASFEEE